MDNNKNNSVSKRESIPEDFKWKLEALYESDEKWIADFDAVRLMVKEIVQYEGRLGDSSENLLKVLRLRDEAYLKMENVFVYARMRKDEDNTVAKYQAMSDKAQGLSVEVTSSLSFIIPEIIAIDEKRVQEFLKENKGLKLYNFHLMEILRQKEHILSREEEKLLAEMGELAAAPRNIFGMINNADIKFPKIKDEDGHEVEITKGRYVKFLESTDRRVRQDAFRGLYASYEAQKNTIASTLNYSVKKDAFYARVRKYHSAMEASLDDDHIPLEVYDNLIKTVEKHMESMYRYMKLRKKVLGVDELHMYDVYTPIVKEVKMDIPYEKAKEEVKNGLKVMGSEYLEILEKAYSEGWIDVYENQGKTSGAYSWGTYSSPPYILLNHQDSVHDMFTLAHELGHSLHSYYSNKNQPYIYSGYKIFVAEVASTVNEALLMDYMLKKTTDKNEKLYLLNHYLEQFRGTVYRQTMFAEFEKIIHDKAEKGEALTPEMLCGLYGDLNKKYYGPDMVIDEEIKLEWARIPHFYNAFYVYKYATGYSAAISLSQGIISQGQPAVEKYMDFLKGGGSDYPIEILKKAGVDMTTPEPIDKALEVFTKLLDEMERLLN